MALQNSRIGVIGGGIAGLGAAIALSRKGAEVTVFEAAPAFGEVGAGLQLSANAVRVLEALGLDPLQSLVHSRPASVSLLDYKSARKVVELDLGNDEVRPFLQVHRADLIAFLAKAAKDLGVTCKFGQRAGLSNAAEGMLTWKGEDYRFDAIIGADGVRSETRAAIGITGKPEFTGYVAWRAVLDMVTLDKQFGTEKTRVFMGPNAHIVTYPLRGGTVLNLVAVERKSDWADEGWMVEGDPDQLRRRFTGWCDEVQDVLAAVEKCFYWGLFAHQPLDFWASQRSVVLGDAAHPMLPFMAQGAAMSIEDAWVLAEALDGKNEIEDGLKQFEMLRKNRASRVQATARSNANIYHLSNPLIRRVAHIGMAGMGRVMPSAITSRYDWIYDADVTKLKI